MTQPKAIALWRVKKKTSSTNKLKLLLAWMEIHTEELIADWNLAVDGQAPYKIDPLR